MEIKQKKFGIMVLKKNNYKVSLSKGERTKIINACFETKSNCRITY